MQNNIVAELRNEQMALREAMERQAVASSQEQMTLRRTMEMQAITSDRRMNLFNVIDGCGSGKISPSVKSTVKTMFSESCLICGSRENISVAHLLGGNPDSFNKFMMTEGLVALLNTPIYRTDFNFSSARNLVVLCGIKSLKGTCHWAFDNHLCCILPHPLVVGEYRLHWLDTKNRTDDPSLPAERILTVPANWEPYTRALSLHAREGIRRHASNDAMAELISTCDLSCSSTSGGDEEYEIDDDDVQVDSAELAAMLSATMLDDSSNLLSSSSSSMVQSSSSSS
jgi:hypothetical protein